MNVKYTYFGNHFAIYTNIKSCYISIIPQVESDFQWYHTYKSHAVIHAWTHIFRSQHTYTERNWNTPR